MEHLEFVEKLSEFGIHIQSTNAVGKIRKYEIYETFDTRFIIEKEGKLEWEKYELACRTEPIKAILAKAIDTPSWSHSWHLEIKPENYEKIKEIIQKRLLGLAKETDEILSIYFLLKKEISEQNNIEL
jgi:hypothetical protein